MATHRQLKLRFTAHLAGEPRKWLQTIRRRSQGKSTANQKPPLPGEVARRSRDGGVSGLCHVVILCVFLRLKAQPKAATPQALRASSPSSGAQKLLWPKTPIAREGSQKPPLPGEVARRSRDGGVSGLCHGVILCFF